VGGPSPAPPRRDRLSLGGGPQSLGAAPRAIPRRQSTGGLPSRGPRPGDAHGVGACPETV